MHLPYLEKPAFILRQNAMGGILAANGCVYEGDFCRGARHGQGMCTFPGGERYSGGWQNGKMHGEGTLELMGRKLKGKQHQVSRFATDGPK